MGTRVASRFAREVVPGFRPDFGSRRGARKWNEVAQAELIADIEAVKHRRREERRGKRSDLQACRTLVSTARYRPRYGSVAPRQSQDKRARSLNTRLVEARNAKTLVARLLANADGELKQLLTDQVISLFTHDPQDAASAKARHNALWKSITRASWKAAGSGQGAPHAGRKDFLHEIARSPIS